MLYQGSDLVMFLSSDLKKNAPNDLTIFNDVNCSHSFKSQA